MSATASWWQLEGPPPLHATRRNPERHSEGPRVALIAEALGTPLLPWQRYTADVAGELRADGRGYQYPVVVVTVPRQSGKTTLMRAVGVDRGLARDACGVFYTAQTQGAARERWAELVDKITASPLAPMARVRRSAGSERVVWPNGSSFRVFAPTATALHGYTPPLVMLDECFSYDEQTGNDLMGAIGPAQVTLPHRQLWLVSTAGTHESTWFRRWVELGRSGADGVAILEWGAGPAVVDIYDPAVWPTYHPGMLELPSSGEQLVTVDALRDEANRLPRSEFERAYGNRWTRTASTLIAAEAWDRLADLEQRPPLEAREAVYAWDVMPDRSSAALVALWHSGGQLQARVARTGQGMGWLREAVHQLHSYGARTFGYAADGPGRELADELARDQLRGASFTPVAGRDYADAWGFLLERIARGTLTHDGSEQLATAAANVATRPLIDTAAPSRRASAGDITPLVALMVGGWVLDHRPPATPAMAYRFAG